MIQWKPFPAVLSVVFSIILAVSVSHMYSSKLVQARAEAKAAREKAAFAMTVAGAALDVADSAMKVADEKTAEAAALQKKIVVNHPAVARIVRQAPDTCKPAIQALEGERDAAQEAYQKQLEATAALQAAAKATVPALEGLKGATGHLSEATEHLEKASKGSFLHRILPEIGVGAAVGVDAHGKPNAVIGITGSYHF